MVQSKLNNNTNYGSTNKNFQVKTCSYNLLTSFKSIAIQNILYTVTLSKLNIKLLLQFMLFFFLHRKETNLENHFPALSKLLCKCTNLNNFLKHQINSYIIYTRPNSCACTNTYVSISLLQCFQSDSCFTKLSTEVYLFLVMNAISSACGQLAIYSNFLVIAQLY